MEKLKIKSGDNVIVTAGEHKGRQGRVISVLKKKNKAVVEDINVVKKHKRPSATNPQGGIDEQEAPIHMSNLALKDGDGNPTRVGYRFEDGKKVRYAKTTNEVI